MKSERLNEWKRKKLIDTIIKDKFGYEKEELNGMAYKYANKYCLDFISKADLKAMLKYREYIQFTQRVIVAPLKRDYNYKYMEQEFRIILDFEIPLKNGQGEFEIKNNESNILCEALKALSKKIKHTKTDLEKVILPFKTTKQLIEAIPEMEPFIKLLFNVGTNNGNCLVDIESIRRVKELLK